MRAFWTALLVVGIAVLAPGCKRGGKPTAAPDDGKGSPSPSPVVGKKGIGTFTIGKATTYVTGPLDASGHIDYAAALNERMSKGVTAENNANVLIWKALGPSPEGTKIPPSYFDKLGIAPLPANDDYFIRLRPYFENQLKAGPGSGTTAFDTLAKLAHRPWKADEQPQIQAWLKANEKPMALLIEATKRTHYYAPPVPHQAEQGPTGIISALLPTAQSCREVAAALTARAMLFAGHGMVDEAWQDLLACHRLARLISRGGTLIEGLVGLAIEQISCSADTAFLAHMQPDAKHLEGYIRDLRALPPMPDQSDKVEFGERFMMLEQFMLLNREGLPYLKKLDGGATGGLVSDDALNGIDWNPALEIVNKWYDRMVAAMREKSRTERVRKMDQLVTDLRAMKESVTQAIRAGTVTAEARSEMLGKIFASLMMPAGGKVQAAADRVTQVHDNVITAFALAWYARDNGRYPNSLDALAPKYLAEVPKDLFSGGGLIYKPTANGYLLYSVGVNGKDDGGHAADDQPPGDDLVVRMPPAAR